MKLGASLALTGLLASIALADSERVSMVMGSSKTLSVPFVIDTFRVVPNNSDRVKVEALDTQLRVMALQVGEVNVLASGGGATRDFQITIKSNLTKVRSARK